MNKKSYSFDMETFRYMLLFCPKLHGQKFVDPPFEEEILTFIRELGYPGNIKLLSDVKVDTLPQPWRTFGTIINKCLSGKLTGIDTLRLSKAQILWGLYHQEKVDYVYLLWEDLVDWHMAKDDPILITMRFIPQHEVVQRYGAILPDYLTNPAMKESEAYKTYHDLATGKVAKSGKKKQPALGLETVSDIVLTEAEQMKLAIKRSKTQLHISQPSSSGTHEGTGVTPGVPDVPTYKFDDEQISWKSSDEEDDDEENVSEHESDNDDEDFVHLKFITHDDEARQEEVNEEDSFDLRVQTPSHVESIDDDDNDDEIQGANVAGEEMDEEATNTEGEENELYRDETKDTHVILTAPINPEGQHQSSFVSSGFVSNMLNPRPDTSIDLIFNLNTEATSLVDVSVTTIVEPPLVSDLNINLEGRGTVMTDATLPNVQAT
ncbi:hypothetical protein Tco_1362174 [Tanacetum coccineum]